MYVNLNALVEKLALDLLDQTFRTQVPIDIEKADIDMLTVSAKFCEISLILNELPPSWVEVTGKEDYVKHSLLDIS